jgi:hypothetical protein
VGFLKTDQYFITLFPFNFCFHSFLFFFFLVVLGFELELARQVLYYLSHAPSPFLCFPDFSNKFSCFWLTGQDYNFLTYASRVGIMTCMYHHIYFD